MQIKKKQAITGLVVTSLLLVSSVLMFFYVKGWFVLYQDDFKVSIEGKDFQSTVKILKVENTSLTVKNEYRDNLKIDKIKIGTNICPNTPNLQINTGITKIDISSCLLGLQALKAYDVSIYTDQGIISEDEILRKIPT